MSQRHRRVVHIQSPAQSGFLVDLERVRETIFRYQQTLPTGSTRLPPRKNNVNAGNVRMVGTQDSITSLLNFSRHASQPINPSTLHTSVLSPCPTVCNWFGSLGSGTVRVRQRKMTNLILTGAQMLIVSELNENISVLTLRWASRG